MVAGFFVVTTPQLTTTGSMTYEFMLKDGVPEAILRCMAWGCLTIRTKDANEVNPWKLVQGEEGAIGDDGIKRWDLHLFSGKGFMSSGGVDESPPNEDGLRHLLQRGLEAQNDVALLMQQDVFDRFEATCRALGISVECYHSNEALSTS